MKIQDSFSAYQVDIIKGECSGRVLKLPVESLPHHPVLIDVHYSSLNYKDALSARGLNRVTKKYPHVPGIDAAGIVVEDRSGIFEEGDQVVVTGNDLGTNTSGGFGKLIRVPTEWVVKIPEPMTLVQSMIVGTAGFTALYGIHRLNIEGIKSDSGEVLVTGATGGVGSFAVFALSQFGFEVIASGRDRSSTSFLKQLGATSYLQTSELLNAEPKPLLPRKWSAAIETVGGSLLDSVIRQTAPKGAIACCGNILGMKLESSILPFILRGISLLGIDSAFCVRGIRESIWKKAAELDFDKLPDNYFRVIPLDKLDWEIDRILEGRQNGRIVIQHT